MSAFMVGTRDFDSECWTTRTTENTHTCESVWEHASSSTCLFSVGPVEHVFVAQARWDLHQASIGWISCHWLVDNKHVDLHRFGSAIGHPCTRSSPTDPRARAWRTEIWASSCWTFVSWTSEERSLWLLGHKEKRCDVMYINPALQPNSR